MGQEDVKNEASMTPADGSKEAPAEDQGPERSLEEEVQQLRETLAQKDEEARANYDRFLRERAELENFKRRMQREKADALRFACEPLIRELLPVVDNLERALEHGNGNGASVLEGVRLVLKSLQEILDRHGVRRIDALGQPFDPARHEAIARVPSEEHAPNHVVEQHHSGYLLHDRLLRPALVTVSGGKSSDKVESKADSD
jgi:molecular chaperone GrpE